eukprot:g55282.t1
MSKLKDKPVLKTETNDGEKNNYTIRRFWYNRIVEVFADEFYYHFVFCWAHFLFALVRISGGGGRVLKKCLVVRPYTTRG